MKPNPRQCQQTNDPQRSFNCSYYDRCLTQAAKGRWDGFTCAACGFSKSPVDSCLAVEAAPAMEIGRTSSELSGVKKNGRRLAVLKLGPDHLR